METATASNRLAIRLATPQDAEGIRRVYAPFAHAPVTFEEEEPDPAEFQRRMEGILAFYPGLVVETVSESERGNLAKATAGFPGPGEKPGSKEPANTLSGFGMDSPASEAAEKLAQSRRKPAPEKMMDPLTGNDEKTLRHSAANMLAEPENMHPAKTTAKARPDGAASCTAVRIVGFAYAHRQSERAAYDWNAELSVYLAPEAAHRGLGSALYGALLELLPLQGIRCAYARVTLPNPASERLHARFCFDTMGIQRNAGFKCGAWRDVAWYVKQIGPFDENPARPTAFPDALAKNEDEARRIVEHACALIRR